MEWDKSEEGEPLEERRDPKVDEAKVVLRQVFRLHPKRVFYLRQLTVLFENRFFHWITHKALNELVSGGEIIEQRMGKGEHRSGAGMRLFFGKGHRYWKRDAARLIALVEKFSVGPLFDALGRHAEIMVDSAMASAGFTISARNVREFAGRRARSPKNLDRIYTKDGRHYGSEIKNRLDYIELKEFEEKILICEELEVAPLFITRLAPKHYVNRLNKAGGGLVMFGVQLYPFGYEHVAEEVWSVLGLDSDLRLGPDAKVKKVPTFPVAVRHELEEGFRQRALRVHIWRARYPVNWSPNPQEMPGKPPI